MQRSVTIQVQRHEVPQADFDGLIRLYPEGNRGGISFHCYLPQESNVLRAIQEYLADRGLTPWLGRGARVKARHEYEMILSRTYDVQDWKRAAYLEPTPWLWLGKYETRRYGKPLQIQGEHAKQRLNIALVNQWWIVVSEKVRVSMEKAGLLHVAFKPVETIGRETTPGACQIWELTSDIFLPPLSPKCELVDSCGNPSKGDNLTHGCYLREGLYGSPEKHYKESAITSVEPFDLARTNERFGPNEIQADHQLVASQRFYQFCVSQAFDMRWIPVRIDPD